MQSNLFTESLDTMSIHSLYNNKHACWEMFHWSLYKGSGYNSNLDMVARCSGASGVVVKRLTACRSDLPW